MLRRELPAGEIALEGEVGDAHRPMMRHHAGHGSTHRHRRRADGARRPSVRDGAHAGRAARARAGRRAARATAAWPASRCATPATWRSSPGFVPDPDPRAKNRAADLRVPAARAGPRRVGGRGPDRRRRPRLLILGGDCTAHAGAMAGLRARHARTTPRDRLVRCPRRLQHARHDAVGQRLGDAVRDALRSRRSRPRRAPPMARPSMEQDAALFGGQVLDEAESRTIAASRIAHFGAGMLGTSAGLAAVDGWAADGRRARRRDLPRLRPGLPRCAGGWAVTMPETGGLALETALEAAVRTLAAAMPVVGFGATAVTLANGDGRRRSMPSRGSPRRPLPRSGDGRRLPGRTAGAMSARGLTSAGGRSRRARSPVRETRSPVSAQSRAPRDPERSGVRHDDGVGRPRRRERGPRRPRRGRPGWRRSRRPASRWPRRRRRARAARSGAVPLELVERAALGEPDVGLLPVVDRSRSWPEAGCGGDRGRRRRARGDGLRDDPRAGVEGRSQARLRGCWPRPARRGSAEGRSVRSSADPSTRWQRGGPGSAQPRTIARDSITPRADPRRPPIRRSPSRRGHGRRPRPAPIARAAPVPSPSRRSRSSSGSRPSRSRMTACPGSTERWAAIRRGADVGVERQPPRARPHR